MEALEILRSNAPGTFSLVLTVGARPVVLLTLILYFAPVTSMHHAIYSSMMLNAFDLYRTL